MKKIDVEFESPKLDNMKSKYIKCWRCNKWVMAKPMFVNGRKEYEYRDRNRNLHLCKI